MKGPDRGLVMGTIVVCSGKNCHDGLCHNHSSNRHFATILYCTCEEIDSLPFCAVYQTLRWPRMTQEGNRCGSVVALVKSTSICSRFRGEMLPVARRGLSWVFYSLPALSALTTFSAAGPTLPPLNKALKERLHLYHRCLSGQSHSQHGFGPRSRATADGENKLHFARARHQRQL